MLCPKCESEMSLRPGGVSFKKNPVGIPYGAFYSCPNCKQTIDAGGTPTAVPTQRMSSAAAVPGATSTPDWDAIAVGKVASNFAQALITSGKQPKDFKDIDIAYCFELAEKIVYWGRDSSA